MDSMILRNIDHSAYLWISLLVLAVSVLPFIIHLEGQRIRAREVAMLSLLSAMTVLGDLLSQTVLPIQMGTAMVILSGIAFGPETGFLVGSLSRFLVNFFLGQGIWTPWQMFAWGLLGFLAGLSFNKVSPSLKDPYDRWKARNRKNSRSFRLLTGPMLSLFSCELLGYISYLILPLGDHTFWGWRVYAFGFLGLLLGLLFQHKRLPADSVTLTAFSFVTVLILYGGIMNLSTVLTANTLSELTPREFWDSARAYYLAGLSYDLWHAFRTAFIVFLLGNRVLSRLERVKIKYGFYRI